MIETLNITLPPIVEFRRKIEMSEKTKDNADHEIYSKEEYKKT